MLLLSINSISYQRKSQETINKKSGIVFIQLTTTLSSQSKHQQVNTKSIEHHLSDVLGTTRSEIVVSLHTRTSTDEIMTGTTSLSVNRFTPNLSSVHQFKDLNCFIPSFVSSFAFYF